MLDAKKRTVYDRIIARIIAAAGAVTKSLHSSLHFEETDRCSCEQGDAL